MTNDPTDRQLAHLKALAEAAAATVAPLDLTAHEDALAADAEAALAREAGSPDASLTRDGAPDWPAIERLARAVSSRQQRRRTGRL